MNSKKLQVPQDILEKKKGFEDLFGDYLTEKQKKILTEKHKSKLDNSDYKIFKIIDFLEREEERLNKINTLLSVKLSNAEKFNQTQNLINKQEEKKSKLNKKIVNILRFEGSHLNIEMGRIFNHVFFKKNF